MFPSRKYLLSSFLWKSILSLMPFYFNLNEPAPQPLYYAFSSADLLLIKRGNLALVSNLILHYLISFSLKLCVSVALEVSGALGLKLFPCSV